jgi:cytochrome oxidase assembly protein ShyY1
MVVGTTLNGRSGHDVVTPLTTEGGTVAVNRGWVPIDTAGPPAVGAAPPTGLVEVIGVLLESQTAGSLGTPGPDGRFDLVGRIDLAELSGQWGDGLLPLYLLLEDQAPAGSELPLPRPAPGPSEGSHLAYAVQWFVFAAIALVGFPLLAMKSAKQRAPVEQRFPPAS